MHQQRGHTAHPRLKHQNEASTTRQTSVQSITAEPVIGMSDKQCAEAQRALLLPQIGTHRREWMLRPWGRRASKRMRVFDAFMFAGELELLQTRLNVLSAVVDIFVIVEGDRAHSGLYNRSLAFQHNRALYEAFMPRIHYSAFRAATDAGGKCEHSWLKHGANRLSCENAMRGSLLTQLAIAGASASDLVLLSDVDEIPRPSIVSTLQGCDVYSEASNITTHPSVFILLASMYMFHTRCHTGITRWSKGPKAGAFFQFDILRDEPWRLVSHLHGYSLLFKRHHRFATPLGTVQ